MDSIRSDMCDAIGLLSRYRARSGADRDCVGKLALWDVMVVFNGFYMFSNAYVGIFIALLAAPRYYMWEIDHDASKIHSCTSNYNILIIFHTLKTHQSHYHHQLVKHTAKIILVLFFHTKLTQDKKYK